MGGNGSKNCSTSGSNLFFAAESPGCFCLRLLGRVLPQPYYDKITEADVPKTSEIKTGKIYEILEKFNKVCFNSGIQYWMDAGPYSELKGIMV